jgi:magnesium transporter
MLVSSGMFRIIEGRAGSPLRVEENPELIGPPEEGAKCWIDLLAPTEADLALLGTRFAFHPLALEDCAHADQRPKSEEYGEYMFIVSQGFECPSTNIEEMRWYELHAFLGSNYLVTVHDTVIPGLEQVWKRVAGDPLLMRRGVDFVYYLLSDRIVDDNFPILDRIGDDLEVIEDNVLTRAEQTTLARIFALKSNLVLMRKVLSPQRDVFALLSRRGDERISERTALYFRDVHDHLARIVESIESNRDLLGNALEAYLSVQGQRTNEVMKALAILSAVFMPLTFITGFFGQNFEHLPFGSDPMMYTMIGSCIALPVALLLWFKSRRWF